LLMWALALAAIGAKFLMLQFATRPLSQYPSLHTQRYLPQHAGNADGTFEAVDITEFGEGAAAEQAEPMQR